MSERMVRANGIDIWTESFGKPTDSPLLLIMGASVQSIYWPEEFIQSLVDQGNFVIRFDNRDTGQSSSFDFTRSPYTLDDMARDAVGVLDAYSLESAHIAGMSMGGMIAQILMLQHRSRVRTAALLMSSPLSGDGGQTEQAVTDGATEQVKIPAAGDLPGPSPEWIARATAWAAIEAHTPEEKIQKRLDSLAMMIGSAEPFDLVRKRQLAEREYARALNYDAADNHTLAMFATRPGDRRPLLAAVDVPTLVIHGTADPILPYPHGVALAKSIAGAELLTMTDVGHEVLGSWTNEMTARIIALQHSAA